MIIATKHDLEALLSDPATHDAALAYLQCLMDERYQFDASGAWGVVEPNALTRLGLTVAEAVGMGAADRAIDEPPAPDTSQQRRQKILADLAAIDAASVRPLRASLAGTATDADAEWLAALEARAAALRAALAGLG